PALRRGHQQPGQRLLLGGGAQLRRLPAGPGVPRGPGAAPQRQRRPPRPAKTPLSDPRCLLQDSADGGRGAPPPRAHPRPPAPPPGGAAGPRPPRPPATTHSHSSAFFLIAVAPLRQYTIYTPALPGTGRGGCNAVNRTWTGPTPTLPRRRRDQRPTSCTSRAR